jgi:thioredoxin reductase (NADPH)
MDTTHHKVIIIGSGPSGLTSALYSARANLAPLMIEGFDAGGQLMITSDVENFPGFPDGVMGPDLMGLLRKQAERFGTTFITDDATAVDFTARPFKVSVRKAIYTADSVIVATGAKARMLGLDSEQRLLGRGVSTCATCDGAFFRDQELLVVGGGVSALE